MMNLVCLLEEPSAEEMLREVLPRLLSDIFNDIDVKYIVFQGKQDLEKRLEKRLKGWRAPDSVFLVLRDQDAGDCKKIKQRLMEKVKESGKEEVTLVRIACSMLESFYLGDLNAVEKGLALKNIAQKQNQAKYRTPDALKSAHMELSFLSNDSYSKVDGSRAIAPHLDLNGNNKSHSFNVLLDGIKRPTTL